MLKDNVKFHNPPIAGIGVDLNGPVEEASFVECVDGSPTIYFDVNTSF